MCRRKYEEKENSRVYRNGGDIFGVLRTVVALPSSVVKCLWEVFVEIWGVVLALCVGVGGVVLSVCVWVGPVDIFTPERYRLELSSNLG